MEEVTIIYRADEATLTDVYTAKKISIQILREGRAIITFGGSPIKCVMYSKVYKIVKQESVTPT